MIAAGAPAARASTASLRAEQRERVGVGPRERKKMSRVRTGDARSGARPGWQRPMPFSSLTATIRRYAVVKTATDEVVDEPRHRFSC